MFTPLYKGKGLKMAFLHIVSGEHKGQKFEIDRDRVVIGRSHDNLVCIDSPSISGSHCEIVRDGRKFTLRDLDSTNGTRLNDIKVKEYRLSPKDVITTGDIQIRFDGPDVEAAETSKADAIPDTQVTVRMGATTQRQSMDSTALPFRKKKDSKFLWITLGILVVILAVAAGAWFIFKLTTS
jgi:pSer/pThr/pTyr-binding forkhead associated (FHA) protein